jgi:hypothetical protein
VRGLFGAVVPKVGIEYQLTGVNLLTPNRLKPSPQIASGPM